MEKMHKVHSVKYNFIMNFILTASGFIFPLITFPYVSRILLETGNGKVAFVTAYVNYFLMVAQLGIPTYGIRACARVRDDKEKLSRTYQELMIINLVTTTLVTGVYFITLFTVPQLFENRTMFLINSCTFILQFMGTNWLFQALEQYDYITVRNIIFKVISIVLMFILVRQSGDYIIYSTITMFAAYGSNVLNFFRARKYVTFRKKGVYDFKQHFRPIMTLFAQSLAISIYTNLDTIMLGFMKGDAQVGYYSAATRIKVILTSLVTSLGNVLLPRMSYYVKKGMHGEFSRLMVKAMNFALFISIPLALFFFISSSESLRFLAGGRYEPAAMTLSFLALCVIPIGITNVIGIQVLTPLEDEKHVMISVVAGAVTDFLLNLAFIPAFGSTGAAAATLIAEIVVLIMQLRYAKDIIKPVRRYIKLPKYVITGLCAAVPTFLLHLIPFPHPVINVIIEVVVFFGIYAGILYVAKDKMITETLGAAKSKLKLKKSPAGHEDGSNR